MRGLERLCDHDGGFDMRLQIHRSNHTNVVRRLAHAIAGGRRQSRRRVRRRPRGAIPRSRSPRLAAASTDRELGDGARRGGVPARGRPDCRAWPYCLPSGPAPTSRPVATIRYRTERRQRIQRASRSLYKAPRSTDRDRASQISVATIKYRNEAWIARDIRLRDQQRIERPFPIDRVSTTVLDPIVSRPTD